MGPAGRRTLETEFVAEHLTEALNCSPGLCGKNINEKTHCTSDSNVNVLSIARASSKLQRKPAHEGVGNAVGLEQPRHEVCCSEQMSFSSTICRFPQGLLLLMCIRPGPLLSWSRSRHAGDEKFDWKTGFNSEG